MAVVSDQPSDSSIAAVSQSQALRLFPDADPETLAKVAEAIARTPQVAPSTISPAGLPGRNIALDPPDIEPAPSVFEPGLQSLQQIERVGEGVVNQLPAIGGVVGLGGGLQGSVVGAALGGVVTGDAADRVSEIGDAALVLFAAGMAQDFVAKKE